MFELNELKMLSKGLEVLNMQQGTNLQYSVEIINLFNKLQTLQLSLEKKESNEKVEEKTE